MAKLIFDGIEISSVSDFASEQGFSSATVATWVKKRQEKYSDFKPVTTIGNSAMFAVSELFAAKNEFGREAKPKPPSQEAFDSVVSKLNEMTERYESLLANFNGLQAEYELLQAAHQDDGDDSE